MRPQSGTADGFFCRSLVISLGLHLALAGLVLLGVGFQKPAAPPVLTVSLVAPDPGLPGPGVVAGPAGASKGQVAAPGALPAAAAPKARSKPLKRQAKPLPGPEEVSTEIPLRPAALPPVVKTSAPIPTPAPPNPPPAPPSTAGPATADLSGGTSGGQIAGSRRADAGSGGSGGAAAGLCHGNGGGGGGTGTGGSGRSLMEAQRHYLSMVRTRILAKRRYPPLARQRHEEGTVRLRFTVSSAGCLTQGVQMVQPSGSQLLDDQARHCVLAASPFPPFPPDLKRDCLTVEVPIVYKLTEMGM